MLPNLHPEGAPALNEAPHTSACSSKLMVLVVMQLQHPYQCAHLCGKDPPEVFPGSARPCWRAMSLHSFPLHSTCQHCLRELAQINPTIFFLRLIPQQLVLERGSEAGILLFGYFLEKNICQLYWVHVNLHCSTVVLVSIFGLPRQF